MNAPFLRRILIATVAVMVVAVGGLTYKILAANGGLFGPTRSNLRQPFANGNGLVAWYPLDGSLNDAVNNYNLTPLSSPAPTIGKFGQGYSFSGSQSAYNSSAVFPANTFTNGITISLWAYNTNIGAYHQYLDMSSGGWTPGLIVLGLEQNAYMHAAIWNAAGNNANVNDTIGNYTTIVANVWQHIVFTYDQSSGKDAIYVNGAQVYSNTPGASLLPAVTRSLIIGGQFNGSIGNMAQGFQGTLDDVRLYNRALSAPEITQLYQGSQPPNCDQACVTWLKLDDNTGTAASDSVSTGGGGTLVGSPSWVSGNYGSGVSLNGSSQYVSLPNLGQTLGTVEFWMNPSSNTGDQRLFSQLSGASSQAGQLALNQSSGESGSLWVYDGSAWQRLSANNSISASSWHLISVTYSGSSATAYIDGTQQMTATSAFSFSGPTASLGGKFLGTTGGTFNGTVDDFRVYSRNLAPEEIADQFRQGS